MKKFGLFHCASILHGISLNSKTNMIQQCCAAGEIHTGTPSGRVDKVHGLDCYIASPPAGTEPKGVIVILPDVFGWKLVNTRILADAYAAKGNYLVYLPELQDGM